MSLHLKISVTAEPTWLSFSENIDTLISLGKITLKGGKGLINANLLESEHFLYCFFLSPFQDRHGNIFILVSSLGINMLLLLG